MSVHTDNNEPSLYWFQCRGTHFDAREIPVQFHQTDASGGDDWIATMRAALNAGVYLTRLRSSHQ